MEQTGKRFYMSQSSLYGLTVYDRISQTPAFSYGAEQNMREFDAINLTTKLNTTLGRTLNLCERYPELTAFDIEIIKDMALSTVSNIYRIASDKLEQIITDQISRNQMEMSTVEENL